MIPSNPVLLHFVVMIEYCCYDGGMCPVVTCHTSDARRPAKPHIVTLFTVHTSLDMTLSPLANQRPGTVSSDQSEACVQDWPQLISRTVIHHPASCLMTTTFIVRASKYENVNRETQDSALPV